MKTTTKFVKVENLRVVLRVVPCGLILLFLLIAAFGCDYKNDSVSGQALPISSHEKPFDVQLSMQQGGVETSLVIVNGGPVTVTAKLIGLTAQEVYSYDWSGTDADIVESNGKRYDSQLVFEPSNLFNSRIYHIKLMVTSYDNATIMKSLHFRVFVSLPLD